MIAGGMFLGAWVGRKIGIGIAPGLSQRMYGVLLLAIVIWGR